MPDEECLVELDNHIDELADDDVQRLSLYTTACASMTPTYRYAIRVAGLWCICM